MKKIFALLLFIVFLFIFNTELIADPPDPPPQGSEEDPVGGGGAPIGSGLLILIGLAGGYGVRKYYLKKKKSLLG